MYHHPMRYVLETLIGAILAIAGVVVLWSWYMGQSIDETIFIYAGNM